MYKTDLKILRRGFKRMMIGLLAAFFFVVAVYGFILVASSTGYAAVLDLIGSVLMLVFAIFWLYTLGV